MRVALIDVDGHNFPNLALMKLSAWHKKNGDSVEWYEPLTAWINPPDKVYMSKVFTFILIIVFIQNYAKIPLMAFLQEDALEDVIFVS